MRKISCNQGPSFQTVWGADIYLRLGPFLDANGEPVDWTDPAFSLDCFLYPFTPDLTNARFLPLIAQAPGSGSSAISGNPDGTVDVIFDGTPVFTNAAAQQPLIYAFTFSDGFNSQSVSFGELGFII